MTDHTLQFSPNVRACDFHDLFGNICTRLVGPPGLIEIRSDSIADNGQPDDVAPEAKQWAVEDLPNEALMFLLGSRYCDFGNIGGGWQRVQAILRARPARIRISPCAERSDGFRKRERDEERIGVCRDFAHPAITLCRCMNIPARYCTGYLGDIGVPRYPAPMDFSAWFEVFLGGRWCTFDARHNHSRIGRILIAHGRDAADVAISTTFGSGALA